MSIQEAIDAPRAFALNGKLKVENSFSKNSVKDLYNRFLSDIENSTDIEQRTKKWYKERWNYISKCNEFMKCKVETLTATDIQKTFIIWRLARAKAQSKVFSVC